LLPISHVLRLRGADVAERVCVAWRVACTALFGWAGTGDEDVYKSPHVENSLAVAQSIGSQLSPGRLGKFLLHSQNFLQPEIISDYLFTWRLSPF
jgi:hypothetical protein